MIDIIRKMPMLWRQFKPEDISMTQKKKPKDEFKKKAPKTKTKTPKKEPYTGGMHFRGNPSKPAYVPPNIRKEQW